MKNKTNKRDLLRTIWISERQDQYHTTTEKDMWDIISHVDDRIDKLTDEQVDDLL